MGVLIWLEATIALPHAVTVWTVSGSNLAFYYTPTARLVSDHSPLETTRGRQVRHVECECCCRSER